MGVRYSDLPTTTSPEENDLLAILDVSAGLLKTCTLVKAVECTIDTVLEDKSGTTIGTTNISGIGDGTVTGAIKNLDTRVSALKDLKIYSMTQSAYDGLPATTKNDGNLRVVS